MFVTLLYAHAQVTKIKNVKAIRTEEIRQYIARKKTRGLAFEPREVQPPIYSMKGEFYDSNGVRQGSATTHSFGFVKNIISGQVK
jgi:hypothetical protein